MKTRVAYIFVLLATVSFAQEHGSTEPHRTVKLPRYMTAIPQPIPDELKISDAPKTARTVDCFRLFTESTSMVKVVRKCGIPDEHQGSGIFIFIYNMADGSIVAVGTPDLKRLLYIDHITRQNGTHLLRKGDSRER